MCSKDTIYPKPLDIIENKSDTWHWKVKWKQSVFWVWISFFPIFSPLYLIKWTFKLYIPLQGWGFWGDWLDFRDYYKRLLESKFALKYPKVSVLKYRGAAWFTNYKHCSKPRTASFYFKSNMLYLCIVFNKLIFYN